MVEEHSGRAYGADDPRFCPLGQNFAEGPQLRLALAMLLQHCRRSGGTGSGGTTDKCGGKL